MLFDRILKRCKLPDGLEGCWIWTGRKSRNGYGRISVRGTERVVHRAMVMLAGRTVYPGEHVDHLCRNRACCNPKHLEVVSPRENTKRGDAMTRPRDAAGRYAS